MIVALRKLLFKIKHIWTLGLQLSVFDLKVDQSSKFFGSASYFIEPIFSFIIFLSIKQLVAKGIPAYPLYLFSGLIMFNFFKRTTADSLKAVVRHDKLINALKVETETFVVSVIARNLKLHLIEILLLLSLIVYFKTPLISILPYLAIVILLTIFTAGVAFALASLAVRFVNLNQLWSSLVRVLWLATPIFYTTQFSRKLGLVFDWNTINPLYYFITAARQAVVYHRLPSVYLSGGLIIMSLAVLAVGIFIFEKLKNRFAEHV